jgi:hydrogenase/urease accessory protein HupE
MTRDCNLQMFKRANNKTAKANLLVFLVAGFFTGSVCAHKASDAYMSIETSIKSNRLSTLKIAVSLRDIDLGVESLDADNDRSITWAEVQAAAPATTQWLGNHIKIQCEGEPLNSTWQISTLESRSDSAYLNFTNNIQCPTGARLALTYRLLKDLDANHRLFVTGNVDEQQLAVVLSGGTGDSVELRAPSNPLTILNQFIPSGLYHIATGWDHLAFLLALLLPISVVNNKAKIFRTVTGFTIGHSITLALATFGFIPQFFWIEPMIALSIGLTAILNFRTEPLRSSAESLALGFGLVHGLGFSSIMREAALAPSLMPWALGGFNIGVEIGQLTAVFMWGLLSYALSHWKHYGRAVVQGGSSALLLLSIYWFVQRVT